MEYPWKRDELISRLNEISDPAFPDVVCADEPRRETRIFSAYDFFIEDERLDDDAASAVGYYLNRAEAAFVQAFALRLLSLIRQMADEFDDREAIAHKDWPGVVEAAKLTLLNLQPPSP